MQYSFSVKYIYHEQILTSIISILLIIIGVYLVFHCVHIPLFFIQSPSTQIFLPFVICDKWQTSTNMFRNMYIHIRMMFLRVNCTGSLKKGMPISQIVLIYELLNNAIS